ncbi:hypothetical protein BSKO_05707 [Bryopsis sp. KO-2023]|nr:hypothetical protein BSKO_05707 [Bryopsis sp. KO-2023]
MATLVDAKTRRHVSPFAEEEAQEHVNRDSKVDVPYGNLGNKSEKMATATVKPTRDVLWQENPDRILKYRAHNLHYYGWIPFVNWRNLKGTIFSDVYLHLQTAVLLAWVGLLHGTGLGVEEKDLRSFIKLFGTPYAGSIFNVGMVMVFILGLFISLVINRWSTIRQAYGQLRGTTQDLCMILAHSIHDANNLKDKRTAKARAEVVRLLNLGHLLVVTRADAQNQEFTKSTGLKTLTKHAWKNSRSAISTLGFSEKVVGEVGDRWDQLWQKKARDVTYEDLLDEGLINPDEWTLLQEGEREGLPSYQTVYYWVQTLVHKCRAAEWIISGPQMLPVILTKINSIVAAGSTVLNTINSQMPYPYVHLVSFTAHAYLIIVSTWFGCFLRVGYPGEKFQAMLNDNVSLVRRPTPVDQKWWTVVVCYLLVTAASVMFQGLLNMHSLLDNPFGRHCAKFPLRAQISQVMNATRAMLAHGMQYPQAFGDVFSLEAVASLDTEYTIAKTTSKASSFADFLHPPSKKEGSNLTPLNSNRVGSRDLSSPRMLSGIKEHNVRPSRLRVETSAVDIAPEEFTPRPVADEGMVRPTEPESAPKTTKCVSRGVSPHNQVLFGNLPETQHVPSHTSHTSGDPTLQELYLQVSVADAMQHSFSTLRSSLDHRTSMERSRRSSSRQRSAGPSVTQGSGSPEVESNEHSNPPDWVERSNPASSLPEEIQ